jgi:hypothetical protein
MNNVILLKDGSMTHNGKTIEDDPLVFLSFKVDLEKGYVLRSYFQMLLKYPLFMELNAFFPTYIEQYLTSSENKCCYEGLDHLEFSKTVEMIGFPGRPRLEIYNSFHGIRANETCEIKSIQLESLLDMPLKLGSLKHIVFEDKMDILEFDTVFSLFEYIDGIAWELSFHSGSLQCELRR